MSAAQTAQTEDTQKVNSQVQSFLQYVSTSDACNALAFSASYICW